MAAPVTVRMLPAFGSGGVTTGTVGPSQQPLRSYSASGGQTIDATGDMSGDAAVLSSSGLFLAFCLSGTAATRRASTPSNFFKPGVLWLDTDNTAQGVILFDGATWRLPTGAAVA
jgi:hypothetical protein